MTDIFALAALWLGLALAATRLSIWRRIATAMSGIAAGAGVQLAIGGVRRRRRAGDRATVVR